jgi:integrase
LHTDDNRANRRLAEDVGRRLDAAIEAGVFDEARYRDFGTPGPPPPAAERRESTRRVPDGPVTLGEFARGWLDEVRARVGPATHYDYLNVAKNYVLNQAVALVAIDQINDGDVSRLIGELQERAVPVGQVNKVLKILRAIFNVASTRRYRGQVLVADNPMRSVKKLRQARPEIDPFNAEEVQRILAAAHGWERSFLTVLIGTGLRPNEGFGLRWPDIDFERAIAIIRRTASRHGLHAPKTERSERDVDLVTPVLAALHGQRARTGAMLGGEGLVFPSDVESSAVIEHVAHVRKGSLGEVPIRTFSQVHRWKPRKTASEGQTPFDLSNFRERHWRRILRTAGLRPRTLYHCRHTFATLLIENNESIKYVADQMGHRDLEMVIRRYARWMRKPEPLVRGGALANVITQGNLFVFKKEPK